jgi:hypothetical protein
MYVTMVAAGVVSVTMVAAGVVSVVNGLDDGSYNLPNGVGIML